MSVYRPPVREMHYLLTEIFDVRSLRKGADLDSETVSSVLEEAARFSGEVLAPLNGPGDREGCAFEAAAVRTPAGIKEAYHSFRQAGWNAVPFDPEYGGQGLPWAMAFALQEMWQGASLSFGLCPLLNQGAVEAIHSHGSTEQKAFYLPRLISGEWTGTMNLTEPQAGSDLAAIRTRAQAREDGRFVVNGQKIFITYGEHDLAPNIVHLVLARIAGAPEGIKGLSLFIVPRILADGSRNGVTCAGLEHKLGIHGSPTCTMVYEDAVGELVGRAGAGLKYMFTMMNNARLSVGLQGVALAERAFQAASAYAHDRVQGALPGSEERVPILHHPDVRRMLSLMDCQIAAARALAYESALLLDRAQEADQAAQTRVDLMTPLVKSWCTDLAVECASTAIQIYGGMGYIEEAGMSQFYRDARILPIYEGTNGIQAADLVFRKIARDSGAGALAWIDSSRPFCAGSERLDGALTHLKETIGWVVEQAAEGRLDLLAAASSPLCRAFAQIAGGVILARCAHGAAPSSGGAQAGTPEEHAARNRRLEIYERQILPSARTHLDIAREGSACILTSPINSFPS